MLCCVLLCVVVFVMSVDVVGFVLHLFCLGVGLWFRVVVVVCCFVLFCCMLCCCGVEFAVL